MCYCWGNCINSQDTYVGEMMDTNHQDLHDIKNIIDEYKYLQDEWTVLSKNMNILMETEKRMLSHLSNLIAKGYHE